MATLVILTALTTLIILATLVTLAILTTLTTLIILATLATLAILTSEDRNYRVHVLSPQHACFGQKRVYFESSLSSKCMYIPLI